MTTRLHRRCWLILSASQFAALAGCGTLLYPERRGQPAGPLDWRVVALDALGLLFFFIPGVVAFAVDFATGTIYLPSAPPLGAPAPMQGELISIKTPSRQPSLGEIEQELSQHAHRDVRLAEGKYFTEPLTNLEQFWVVQERWSRSHSASGAIQQS